MEYTKHLVFCTFMHPNGLAHESWHWNGLKLLKYLQTMYIVHVGKKRTWKNGSLWLLVIWNFCKIGLFCTYFENIVLVACSCNSHDSWGSPFNIFLDVHCRCPNCLVPMYLHFSVISPAGNPGAYNQLPYPTAAVPGFPPSGSPGYPPLPG